VFLAVTSPEAVEAGCWTGHKDWRVRNGFRVHHAQTVENRAFMKSTRILRIMGTSTAIRPFRHRQVQKKSPEGGSGPEVRNFCAGGGKIAMNRKI